MMQPKVLSAGTLLDDEVKNLRGESLGEIKELMIDMETGRVSYAVLDFGGFLGIGNKLFAVPWQALTLQSEEHAFILDVDKEKLKQAPGFDKDHWPNFADPIFANEVNAYYGYTPF